MFKVLITSVGSLVGQNILDVLEYKGYLRRHLVHIIGTNSIANVPGNFRCDTCYLVPETRSESFIPTLTKILEQESPDLVLHGRDEDTEILARIKEDNPSLMFKTPYGCIDSILLALNKWETWQFACKYNLPFAETLLLHPDISDNELELFVAKHSFPLIAKPVIGFASKGVFFILNWQQLKRVSKYENYILQEYLGNSQLLHDYFKLFEHHIPLFAHAPNISHHSCHIFIYPNGRLSDVFISNNRHQSGVTMGFKKVENKTLEDLTLQFGYAVYQEGGFGPLTVQFREDATGNWKAQEMNMRTNGNTFPRFLMGQDDLAMIVQSTFPQVHFPLYVPATNPRDVIIQKSLFCEMIYTTDITKIREAEKWEKDPNK